MGQFGVDLSLGGHLGLLLVYFCVSLGCHLWVILRHFVSLLCHFVSLLCHVCHFRVTFMSLLGQYCITYGLHQFASYMFISYSNIVYYIL